MPQVQLTSGGAPAAAVRNAIDDQRTHAADAFAAVGVKSDRIFAARDQFFIHHVEHFQEGHIGKDIPRLVNFEAAGRVRVFLPPNFQCEVHVVGRTNHEGRRTKE